ncbi:MAG: hypothetical protein H7841_04625, partial [Magnetospirillum sp. WYHS-4]
MATKRISRINMKKHATDERNGRLPRERAVSRNGIGYPGTVFPVNSGDSRPARGVAGEWRRWMSRVKRDIKLRAALRGERPDVYLGGRRMVGGAPQSGGNGPVEGQGHEQDQPRQA